MTERQLSPTDASVDGAGSLSNTSAKDYGRALMLVGLGISSVHTVMSVSRSIHLSS